MRNIKDILSNEDLSILFNNIEEERDKASDKKDKYLIQRDYVITYLIAFYGFTIEEINKITFNNIYISPSRIELKNKTVSTSNRFNLQMAYLVDYLDEYSKDNESIFTIEEIDYDHQIQRYTKNIDKEVNYHELRTFCISSLINTFANLHKLKEYLGIKNLDKILPYYVGYPVECSETSEHVEAMVYAIKGMKE